MTGGTLLSGNLWKSLFMGKKQWIITSIAGFSDVNRIVTRWCAAVSWMEKPHVNFGYNYVQLPWNLVILVLMSGTNLANYVAPLVESLLHTIQRFNTKTYQLKPLAHRHVRLLVTAIPNRLVRFDFLNVGVEHQERQEHENTKKISGSKLRITHN